MASVISPSTTFDIVCIGFGTKGLALSTILADHDSSQKVLVVERGNHFDAELASAFPDHGMASTFLRDLITLRNPRSPYTFINFLHETELLIDFTNVSQLSTTRRLATQYLTWVADKIERLGWVAYGKEVVNIKPRKSRPDGVITEWTLDLRARENGAASKVICKKVVIATSPMSRLPEALSSPRIAPYTVPLSHAENVLDRIHRAERPLNIAILGADQEAIELFEHLVSSPGGHKATLIFKASALRAVDSTPFAQELIDGARISNTSLHHLPPELRQRLVSTTVSAEFPTVDLHVLENLYALLYNQSISQADKSQHRFHILPQTHIRLAQLSPQGRVHLDLVDAVTSQEKFSAEEVEHKASFDLVVVATERQSLPGATLLAPLFRSLDLGTESSQQNAPWTVDGGYKINLRRNATAPGCGIWVLGTLASLHARRTDLSILSATAGRAVDSLLEESWKGEKLKENGRDRGQISLL